MKSVHIRSFSGPSETLRIQSKCGEKLTRKTPNTNTFHAVKTEILVVLYFLTRIHQHSNSAAAKNITDGQNFPPFSYFTVIPPACRFEISQENMRNAENVGHILLGTVWLLIHMIAACSKRHSRINCFFSNGHLQSKTGVKFRWLCFQYDCHNFLLLYPWLERSLLNKRFGILEKQNASLRAESWKIKASTLVTNSKLNNKVFHFELLTRSWK